MPFLYILSFPQDTVSQSRTTYRVASNEQEFPIVQRRIQRSAILANKKRLSIRSHRDVRDRKKKAIATELNFEVEGKEFADFLGRRQNEGKWLKRLSSSTMALDRRPRTNRSFHYRNKNNLQFVLHYDKSMQLIHLRPWILESLNESHTDYLHA